MADENPTGHDESHEAGRPSDADERVAAPEHQDAATDIQTQSEAPEAEPVAETPGASEDTEGTEVTEEDAPTPAPAPDTDAPETVAPAPETGAPASAAAPAADSDPAPETSESTPVPSPGPRPTPKPAPVPHPGPAAHPVPRPVPHASPAALAGKQHAPVVPAPVAAAQSYDAEQVEAATQFGRVADDGTVFVTDGSQEREVGSLPDDEPKAALEFFARKYLDIVAFLDGFQARVEAGDQTLAEVNRNLEQLRKNLKQPAAVGDIPALRERGRALRERAKERLAELEAERTAAKDAAAAQREAFVADIEKLVAADPEKIHWKNTGERIRGIVPEWKRLQKEGPSIDREVEDKLWKRLSTARSTFDRNRRAFFSQLDEQHADAKRIKEDLIAQAESLQNSTDWGPTVRAYKDLMSQWRQAPRGNRKTDDAQWARFKSAQDTFFDARNADLASSDAEQRENLAVKERLLTEAQALLPVTDLDAAKKALRSIQDRWEAAGKVPRQDMRRIEDRMRAVEREVKAKEQDEWRRSDPETKARVDGASEQLHAAIAQLEQELTDAETAGDAQRIAQAREALDARRQWLSIVERSASELR